MSNKEVMQQALEALEALQGGCTDHDDGTVEAITVWCPEVIAALRAALAEQADPKLRYDGLYEYAAQHRLNYNDLCRVVRAALTEPVQEPVEWLPLTDAQLRAMFEIGEQE